MLSILSSWLIVILEGHMFGVIAIRLCRIGKPWRCFTFESSLAARTFLPQEMGLKGFVRGHWSCFCARVGVLQNATLSVESVCTA